MNQQQPIKIAILAMGGEGGGVLADWIVSLGEANGCFAQTTSVPGVAQRTGATIYYVELLPGAGQPATRQPVLALMPLPGDVDIVLCSELMEAGRAVQRGLRIGDEEQGAQIEAESDLEGVTGFLNPEDAVWDPDNPNVIYFVTTGSTSSSSRLYKATFTDITQPELGGTIEALLVGNEGQRRLDSIEFSDGKLILEEDPGSSSRLATVWEYDLGTDSLVQLAQFDPAASSPEAPISSPRRRRPRGYSTSRTSWATPTPGPTCSPRRCTGRPTIRRRWSWGNCC